MVNIPKMKCPKCGREMEECWVIEEDNNEILAMYHCENCNKFRLYTIKQGIIEEVIPPMTKAREVLYQYINKLREIASKDGWDYEYSEDWDSDKPIYNVYFSIKNNSMYMFIIYTLPYKSGVEDIHIHIDSPYVLLDISLPGRMEKRLLTEKELEILKEVFENVVLKILH